MNFENLHHEIEERLDEMRRGLAGWGREHSTGGALALSTRTPACDLIDDETQFILTAELPGIDKKDIRLEVEDNAVRIRATTEHEREEKDRGYLRKERSSTSFERSMTLPDEVSPDGVRAHFKNGVLEVTLPKTAPEKRRARSVEVD